MDIKSLFKKPDKFTNYDPNSPASKAARRWDEREGQIIEQNQNLRKLTIGLMVTIAALGGALVYKSMSSSMVPYVVTLDATTGEVRNVGTAQSMNSFQPTDKMYEYFIRQFVTDVRSVPLDPVVYRHNVDEAQAYLTRDGANLLTNKAKEEKLTERFGQSTVQVQIISIVKMEGGKSYQVRWSEDEYSIGGGKKAVNTYTGIFTVEHIQTDDEKQLAKNPVGMYISDFSWAKDASNASANAKNNNANAQASNTNANANANAAGTAQK